MSEKSIFAEVETELGSPEPEARRLAVQLLEQLSGEAAPPLLVRALADEDWRVRKEASQVASHLLPRGPVVETLVGALAESGAIGLRNSAVEALVGIGPEAVSAVIESIEWLDADGRKLAAEVLAAIPDERCVTSLVQLLTDDDTNVRATAAEGLAVATLAGDEARTAATRALVKAAHEDELFVRLAALEGLAKLEAELDWAELEPLLADAVTRRHALAFAARSAHPAALAALARAVGDPSPTLAGAAAEALVRRLEDEGGLLSPALAHAAEVLCIGGPEHQRLLSEATSATASLRARSAALALLGLIGDPRDVPMLSLALGDEGLAERAELALRLYGEQAIEPMIVAAREAPSDVRAAALSMVPAMSAPGSGTSNRPFPAGTADLRGALAEASPDLRAMALKMLAQVGAAEDIPTIASHVSDPHAVVATAAAYALMDLALLHREAALQVVKVAVVSNDADGPSAAGCLAAAALARAGEPLDAGMRAMALRALVHGEAPARRASLETLAALASRNPTRRETTDEERAAVAFALADEERDVVAGAVRALAAMKHAEPLVTFLAATDDSFLKAAALGALAEANPALGYKEALVWLSSPDPAVATAAVTAVAQASSADPDDEGETDGTSTSDAQGRFAGREDQRAAALAFAARHADDGVVKAALTELARTGARGAWLHVEAALGHANWKVRRFAAELLATRAPGSDDAKLRAALEHERDPMVREAITLALTHRAGGGGGRDREGT